jgi:RNA polymerase sigma factor (sigma-70 family)
MARTVDQLTEDQQKLAVAYWPLARSLARPFKDQIPDASDEYESVACLALTEAARTYQTAQSLRFATWARHHIVGALRTARRERIERGRRLLLVADLVDEQYSVLNRVADLRRAPLDELDLVEAFEARIRGLPSRYAEALRLIYRDGLTHAEAGRVMGFSPSRITAMHRDAVGLLRLT